MFIILDTNIFIEDWYFASPPYKALLDYAKKTASTFLMPRIVLEELRGKFAQELEARHAAYSRAEREFNRHLNISKAVSSSLDLSSEADKYIKSLLRRLKINKNNILDYPVGALEVLVSKAIKRAKPFTSKGEEFRDALLWETVIDARLKRDVPEHLVFISNDTSAFGNVLHKGKEGELHPYLQEEAEQRMTRNIVLRDEGEKHVVPHMNSFGYFRKVSEFIAEYHDNVSSISKPWIKKQLILPELKGELLNLIKDDGHFVYQIKNILRRRRLGEFTGIITDMFTIKVENYSIYTNSDSSVTVFFTLLGHIELAYASSNRSKYQVATFAEPLQTIEAEYYDIDFEEVMIMAHGTIEVNREGEVSHTLLYDADVVM